MVVGTSRIEQLLQEKTEPSWLLFEYVLPIIEAFEEGKRLLPSIDYILKEDKERKERILAGKITAWISVGMEDLYAAEDAFARYIIPEKLHGVYIHQCRDYANYHDTVVDHLERVQQFNRRIIDDVTKETIKRIRRQHTPQSGRKLGRPVYLALKHGDLHIKQNGDNPQVIFQIARIKNMERMAAKFARKICKSVQDYNNLIPTLQRLEKNLEKNLGEVSARYRIFNEKIRGVEYPELGEKVQETLSAMHAYGMKTPFAVRKLGEYTESPDLKEYLMMGSRVSDVLGIISVTRTREEAELVLEKAKKRAFSGSERYEVLRGKRLTHNNRHGKEGWHYVDDFIVDNHITAQEKVIADGGMHIFTYLRQRFPNHRRKYRSRVDFGVQALPDFCEDAVGGRGSHIIYERRQEEKVESWKRKELTLYNLYQRIYAASLGVLSRVDVKQFELYPELRAK